MANDLNIRVGPPELLGEPVQSRLGQAAALSVKQDGDKEFYFVSNGSPATFYVLDAVHGHIKFSYDIAGADTVWAMTVANDGNVYFSGTMDGILYRYLPETKQVQQVAQSAEDRFVWDIQAAADGTIVSATYPRCKVFAYDTRTNEFSDLGSMSAKEQYARSAAVTADAVYTGIGSTIQLMRFDRQTGAKQELFMDGYTGEKGFVDRIWVMGDLLFLSVNRSEIVVYDEHARQVVDQIAGAEAIVSDEQEQAKYYLVKSAGLWTYDSASKALSKLLDLPNCSLTTKIKLMQRVTLSNEEWKAIADRANFKTKAAASRGSGDRRAVLAIVSCYADVWYVDLESHVIIHTVFDIPTKPLLIQSIEADEDGMLYIGGYHRGLCLYDPEEESETAQFPAFPQIEGIGMLNQKVFFGTYTQAKIYEYDKNKPLQTAADDKEANPKFVFPIGHGQDRPFTFTSGDQKLFIGTIPDYGLNTGALTVYDAKSDKWAVYPDVAPNLSVVGLAYHEGLLYGGTSIWGGLGQDPVESEAHIFIFDVAKGAVIDRFVPKIPDLDVPPKMIGELSAGPDGNLWGAVDGTLFVMEPRTGEVLRSKQVSPSKYNGKFRPVYLRWGRDGFLYTALGRMLVVVDPSTLAYEIIDKGPLSIMTLGRDGHLYYGSGSRLFRRRVEHL